MIEVTGDVGEFSHLFAFLGYLGLAGLLIWRRESTAPGLAMILAALLTAFWAGVVSFAYRFGGDYTKVMLVAETFKTVGWTVFLITLLSRSWRLTERVSYSFVFAVGVGFIFTGLILIDTIAWLAPVTDSALALRTLDQISLFGRIIGAVGAIVLVENVYRNAMADDRWGIRMLCIALVGVFGYDVYLYTDALLFGGSPDLFAARGIITVLLVPLIVTSVRRARQWRLQMQLSRQVVFHSISLIVVGAYLLAMALASYGLRLIGGDWGQLLQVGMLFTALVTALVVLVSGRFRAWLRVKINKHFFAYKYDYREEWLKFIGVMSQSDPSAGSLEHRVIRATCDILDSPGGVLWLTNDQGAFEPSARLNYRAAAHGAEVGDSPFVAYLTDRQRIINFEELKTGSGDYDGLETPDWAKSDPTLWLAAPLIHIDRLIGFLVIAKPRVNRSLNWEDFDLLKTIGRQAASYIAEGQSQAALYEASQFDAFNRRFAFIIHDLKNLVSQLSLVSRNAQRFANNPEFQADMLLTIQDSVEKMNTLLARLKQHNTGRPAIGAVNLHALVRSVVQTKANAYSSLTFCGDGAAVTVQADEGQLEQVFNHLIQNAIDASSADAPIVVALAEDATSARVDIVDHGCGMTDEFIRNGLFTPFASTKAGGFGIGAYEAREIVLSFGGKLDVRSELGAGSTFTVSLPLAGASA
jgi:putative PEP-CTERM system histidine kinase